MTVKIFSFALSFGLIAIGSYIPTATGTYMILAGLTLVTLIALFKSLVGRIVAKLASIHQHGVINSIIDSAFPPFPESSFNSYNVGELPAIETKVKKPVVKKAEKRAKVQNSKLLY